MESDEDNYKATPQIKGALVHETVDNKKASTRSSDIQSLPVYSDSLRICGKIDIYKADKRLLIERKNNLKQIFRGQLYQLWGQYYCMLEMGYRIEQIAFYEISTNRMIPIPLPNKEEHRELEQFINQFRQFNPLKDTFSINSNKCKHCIYCSLCDKSITDNVYT